MEQEPLCSFQPRINPVEYVLIWCQPECLGGLSSMGKQLSTSQNDSQSVGVAHITRQAHLDWWKQVSPPHHALAFLLLATRRLDWCTAWPR